MMNISLYGVCVFHVVFMTCVLNSAIDINNKTRIDENLNILFQTGDVEFLGRCSTLDTSNLV